MVPPGPVCRNAKAATMPLGKKSTFSVKRDLVPRDHRPPCAARRSLEATSPSAVLRWCRPGQQNGSPAMASPFGSLALPESWRGSSEACQPPRLQQSTASQPRRRPANTIAPLVPAPVNAKIAGVQPDDRFVEGDRTSGRSVRVRVDIGADDRPGFGDVRSTTYALPLKMQIARQRE